MRKQEKAILLILMGLVGTLFMWAGGVGFGRYVSSLPTNENLMAITTILGIVMLGFVSSYAATHVGDDE